MKLWKKLLLIVLVAAAAAFLGVLGFTRTNAAKQQRLFDDLSLNRPVFTAESASSDDAEEESPYSPDYVGWVDVAGTRIHYPVMQSVSSPRFYENRNFNGEISVFGVPYLDASCDPFSPDDTLILYGRSFTTGEIFSNLSYYNIKKFWQEHPLIKLERETGLGFYEIFTVLNAKTQKDEFALADHIQMESEEAYTSFIESLQKESLFATEVTPKPGEQLLFLVTTGNSSRTEGHMIVGARLIQWNERGGEKTGE